MDYSTLNFIQRLLWPLIWNIVRTQLEIHEAKYHPPLPEDAPVVTSVEDGVVAIGGAMVTERYINDASTRIIALEQHDNEDATNDHAA